MLPVKDMSFVMCSSVTESISISYANLISIFPWSPLNGQQSPASAHGYKNKIKNTADYFF